MDESGSKDRQFLGQSDRILHNMHGQFCEHCRVELAFRTLKQHVRRCDMVEITCPRGCGEDCSATYPTTLLAFASCVCVIAGMVIVRRGQMGVYKEDSARAGHEVFLQTLGRGDSVGDFDLVDNSATRMNTCKAE